MWSPTHKQSMLDHLDATSSHKSAPLSPKQDRSADYAAVRNLAESYGVDLLPLDLGFTPLKTQLQSSGKAAQRHSAGSNTELPDTPEVGEVLAAGAASGARGFKKGHPASRPASAELNLTAGRPCSPLKPRCLTVSTTASPVEQPATTAHTETDLGVSGYPIDVDSSDVGSPVESARYAQSEFAADSLLAYDEEMPIEERVTILEEERDMLVDKLLATTDALHKSEARYRQSEASQNQVQALLEQLQELLRRAEVERDRATLHQKRQRTSNNQAMFDSTDDSSDPSLAAKPFSLGAFGCRAPAFKLAGFGIPYGSRPRSKKYKASSGGTAELSTGGGGSTSMQQALKSTAASAAASRDGLAAVVASQESTDASATGKFGDAAAAASAAGMDASGGVSALAGGHMECASSPSPGVHHTATQPTGCPGVGALARGGSSSSCGSSPAVAAVLAVEPVVQLTPSTDEARPPVSSVVRGFEALLKVNSGLRSSLSSGGGKAREKVPMNREDHSGSCSTTPDINLLEPCWAAAHAVDAFDAAAAASAAAVIPVTAAKALQASPVAQADGADAAQAAEEAPVARAEEAAQDVSEPRLCVADAQEGPAVAVSTTHAKDEALGHPHLLKRSYADAAVAGAEAERSRLSELRLRSGAGSGVAASSSSSVSSPKAAPMTSHQHVGSSHRLDISTEDEDEVVTVAGGGALQQHIRCLSTPQGVYHPLSYISAHPLTGSLLTTQAVCTGETCMGLPGQQQASSWLPADMPSEKKTQQATSAQRPLAESSGGRLGRHPAAGAAAASPGSAFGSLISFDAGSPGADLSPEVSSSALVADSACVRSGGKGQALTPSHLGSVRSPRDAQQGSWKGQAQSGCSSCGKKQQQRNRKGSSQAGSSSGAGVVKCDNGANKQHTRQQQSLAGSMKGDAAAAAEEKEAVRLAAAQMANGRPGKQPEPGVSHKASTKLTRASALDSCTTSSRGGSSMRSALARWWSQGLLLVVLLVLAAVSVTTAVMWRLSLRQLAAVQRELAALQHQVREQPGECTLGQAIRGQFADL